MRAERCSSASRCWFPTTWPYIPSVIRGSLWRSCFCATAGLHRLRAGNWLHRASTNGTRRVECPTSPGAGEAVFRVACSLRMDALCDWQKAVRSCRLASTAEHAGEFLAGRHWSICAAGPRLYRLRQPRGRVNALPNTDDLACKIQVTDAKRQNFTDVQTKDRSYSQYSAERFRCGGDDFPSFLISEAALLFFDSLIPPVSPPSPCEK